jgi:WD40 repeat protein
MDQTVKLWDTATGALRETIVPGETGTSSGMGAGSASGVGGVGGVGGTQEHRLFDRDSGKLSSLQPRVVIPHGDKIEAWAAAYSPDGKILITGASSGPLSRWDASRFPGLSVRPLAGKSSGANKIVFAPDGKTFATANWDRTVRLWDAGGNQLATLRRHTDAVRSVAFSPDGQLLASGSWDRTVKIWDVASRLEIRSIPAQELPVNAVAFSPDGKMLATGTGDWRTDKPGEVELWDPATGKRIRNAWHAIRDVKDLAFSPDGKQLAVAHAGSRTPGGDGAVVCLNLGPEQEFARTIKCPSGATAVAFSPDGSLLAVGSWIGKVLLVDTASLNVLATLGLHLPGAMIFDAAFSPDSKFLATASKDGTVKIWPVGDLAGHRTESHAASR